MLLIFRMGRPDVLPVTDYGVRKGFALTFQRLPKTRPIEAADLPKPDVVSNADKRWAPFRSVASWYLWRACDLAQNSARPLAALSQRNASSTAPPHAVPIDREVGIPDPRTPTIIRHGQDLPAPSSRTSWPQPSVTSAFMATSTSRRARIRGSKRSRRRTPPRPITTGTSASAPSATPPTAPPASSTTRTRSPASSTTTRA